MSSSSERLVRGIDHFCKAVGRYRTRYTGKIWDFKNLLNEEIPNSTIGRLTDNRVNHAHRWLSSEVRSAKWPAQFSSSSRVPFLYCFLELETPRPKGAV